MRFYGIGDDEFANMTLYSIYRRMKDIGEIVKLENPEPKKNKQPERSGAATQALVNAAKRHGIKPPKYGL